MLLPHIFNQNIIFINDLNINITIGKEVWEREIKQTVTLNISLNTDDNNQTLAKINHIDIISLVINFCVNNTFSCLENFVAEIEKIIKQQNLSILASQISAKLLFPTNNVKEIGVTIARNYTTNN